MTIAFLFVAAMLLIGMVLRQNLAVFRWLYIPASVIAGLLALLVVQASLELGSAKVVEFAVPLSKTLGSWPGFLIAVVFAGMLLQRQPGRATETAHRVARQGIMVWVIVLGETAVGLMATWLLVWQFYDVPNSFGMLIETGFAGGHGTAAAMGEVFAHPTVNLRSGRDLGMLMATCGLVYGVVSGILWINVGVRKGWVSKREKVTGEQAGDPVKTVARTSGSETIDPMLLQVIWLSIAFGIGLAMQTLVMQGAGWVDVWLSPEQAAEGVEGAQKELKQRLSVSNVVDFPIFIYTLFGGLIVRRVLTSLGLASQINSQLIGRLTSAAMDILVVAAIASLNLRAVAAMIVPFTILFASGAIWTGVCLMVISRWLLPREHWFELGLINYGMSTGTTATGFVLLRMVDPELESGAASDYALAAPLSAPFIGGGIFTIAFPLLMLESLPIWIAAVAISGIVFGFALVGARINRRHQEIDSN